MFVLHLENVTKIQSVELVSGPKLKLSENVRFKEIKKER